MDAYDLGGPQTVALKASKRAGGLKIHSVKLTPEQETGLNALAKARKKYGKEPSVASLIRAAIDSYIESNSN
jgi:predicted DNA-binding protein